MIRLQESLTLLVLMLVLVVARKPVLRELKVPSLVDIRDNVTLSCRFDLGGDRLYSVKWYKDEFEFYRFMPDNLPPCHHLPVPGVTLLNEAPCNMENVTLTKLTVNSSGVYRCEVSTEAPNFQTVFKNSNMTVIALPLKEPVIEGALSSYSIGDRVQVLCISDRSNPPSELAWFINDVEAERWILNHVSQADEVDATNSLVNSRLLMDDVITRPAVDSQGLHTRTLGLNFTTEKRFFSSRTGKMDLRCTATVGNRTWSQTVTSTLSTLTNLGLAQERLANHSHPTTKITWESAVILLVILTLIS
ncbi:synaptogenesis protein syg-1 [Anabrus simplex]|uniref:synaptogenesis protein syg-1 n=1 Tax=Anabrus simplex TaxID=316456 RepID=UPI0034DDC9C7